MAGVAIQHGLEAEVVIIHKKESIGKEEEEEDVVGCFAEICDADVAYAGW